MTEQFKLTNAEEWIRQIPSGDTHTLDCVCQRCKNGKETFLIPVDISAIQLEAIRYGMAKAAEIAGNHKGHLVVAEGIEKSILTAAKEFKL